MLGLGGDLLLPDAEADGVKGEGDDERMSSWDSDVMELIMGSLPVLPSRGPKKPEPTRFGKNGVCVPDEVGLAEGEASASREA